MSQYDSTGELDGTGEWNEAEKEEQGCQHPMPYAVSLGKCAVVCAYCGETMHDLNPQMPEVLQVKRDVVECCPVCEGDVCKHGLCKDTGDPWTDGCPGSRSADGYQCQNCGEAAEQQFLSDYYGGDSTFSMSPQDQAIALYQQFKAGCK